MDILEYKVYSNQELLNTQNSSQFPQASILIGFYNSRHLFDLLMASLEEQTFKNFEVILCDDGSQEDVVSHIHHYMKSTPLLIQHIWHKDDGWRKVELLNKALKQSNSDYIITIDQDCILHPEFIREHIENRQKNTALAGRRVELSPFLSRLITPERIHHHFLQKNYWWMFFFLFFIKDNQWDKGLYIRNKWLRSFFNRKKRSLVGCNMSFYKDDILKINGFDMSQKVSCGAEDADIEYRFVKNGVQIKPLCHSAIQYHIYHPIRSSNFKELEVFLYGKRAKGIDIYLGYDATPSADKIQLKV